jgi:hypothetical protein
MVTYFSTLALITHRSVWARRIASSRAAKFTSSNRNRSVIKAVALMDADGPMTLLRPLRHSGKATLVRKDRPDTWESLVAEAKDIATYVAPLIGARPFGVKIDVEGAEPVIMPWLLKSPTLEFIVFEASQNQKSLYAFVRDAGFVLYGLERRLFAKSLRRINALEQLVGFHDVVAIRLPSTTKAPVRISSRSMGELIRGKP